MKANFESIKEIILKEIKNDNFEITVDQSVIKRIFQLQTNLFKRTKIKEVSLYMAYFSSFIYFKGTMLNIC
jgi:hypothetical protein